jgi:hypothetical protein
METGDHGGALFQKRLRAKALSNTSGKASGKSFRQKLRKNTFKMDWHTTTLPKAIHGGAIYHSGALLTMRTERWLAAGAA